MSHTSWVIFMSHLTYSIKITWRLLGVSPPNTQNSPKKLTLHPAYAPVPGPNVKSISLAWPSKSITIGVLRESRVLNRNLWTDFLYWTSGQSWTEQSWTEHSLSRNPAQWIPGTEQKNRCRIFLTNWIIASQTSIFTIYTAWAFSKIIYKM